MRGCGGREVEDDGEAEHAAEGHAGPETDGGKARGEMGCAWRMRREQIFLHALMVGVSNEDHRTLL